MPFRVWGSATDADQDLPVVSLNDYLELPGLFRESISSSVKNLKLTADTLPLDFFRVGLPLFVSAQLMEVIRPFCHAVEFLPVLIEIEGVDTIPDAYFLANIMDHVDCLDEVNGRYTYWKDGTIDEIKVLALNESKMEGHNLFWVDRTPPILLCASQAVQDAVRKEGFTGIGFREPCKWKIMNDWQ